MDHGLKLVCMPDVVKMLNYMQEPLLIGSILQYLVMFYYHFVL